MQKVYLFIVDGFSVVLGKKKQERMKRIKKRKKTVDENEQVEDDHLTGSSVCFPLYLVILPKK